MFGLSCVWPICHFSRNGRGIKLCYTPVLCNKSRLFKAQCCTRWVQERELNFTIMWDHAMVYVVYITRGSTKSSEIVSFAKVRLRAGTRAVTLLHQNHCKWSGQDRLYE